MLSIYRYLSQLFIIAITFITFKQGLNAELLTYDTYGYIIDNPNIKELSLTNLYWMFSNTEYMANWHPLTWLVYALEYHFFGLEPFGYHVVNLVFHILNALLIFQLTIQLCLLHAKYQENEIAFGYSSLMIASITALLFAIHPQRVESVVWIAELKDVLCLFFSLLTLISYLYYAQTLKKIWYGATLFFFIFALMAKAMAITLPVILILLDIYPTNRANFKKYALALLIEKLPFLFLSCIVVFLTLHGQQQAMAGESVSFLFRVLNSFHTIVFYFSKLLFPFSLSPFYPYPDYANLAVTVHIVPVVAVLLISFLCVWYVRQHPYGLFAWLFFLITLAPVIGIVQVGLQGAADRYTYFATLPCFMLLGVAIVHSWQIVSRASVIWWARAMQILIIVGVSGVITGYAVLTMRYVPAWQSEISLWKAAVNYAPREALFHQRLALAYLAQSQLEQAKNQLQQAIALKKDFPTAYFLLGQIYLRLQQPELALENYQILLRLIADFPITQQQQTQLIQAYVNTAILLYERQRLAEAKTVVMRGLQIEPQNETLLTLSHVLQ